MEILNSLLFMLCEMSPYILLGFFIAGIMHAFIPQQAFARHLSGRGFKSVIKAAMVGVPLPLCSCGVLPTAISMRRNGASRAASTSFLIATPQTGVDSIAATWSLLGPAFALIRPIAALTTSIFGGVAVGKVERDDCKSNDCCVSASSAATEVKYSGFFDKVKASIRYGFVDLVGSIGGWLIAGLIVAALITVYVPEDFFSILGKTPILSMIAVLVIAIPMYVCATGSIPIAMSLMLKGLSPGTALVLLMAGPAANFASFTLISREMGKKAAWVYLASIVIGSIAFGLAIDYLLPSSWFSIGEFHAQACHPHQFSWFQIGCSIILGTLLLRSVVKIKILSIERGKLEVSGYESDEENENIFVIVGMNCNHCRATVERTIAGVEGVTEVKVNLSSGRAVVSGDYDAQAVVNSVRSAGFDAVPQ